MGEVKHYLEKNQAGLTSKPNSPEELSQNVLKIIKNKALAKQLGKKARQLAKKELSWQKVARQLNQVYENTLS